MVDLNFDLNILVRLYFRLYWGFFTVGGQFVWFFLEDCVYIWSLYGRRVSLRLFQFRLQNRIYDFIGVIILVFFIRFYIFIFEKKYELLFQRIKFFKKGFVKEKVIFMNKIFFVFFFVNYYLMNFVVFFFFLKVIRVLNFFYFFGVIFFFL